MKKGIKKNEDIPIDSPENKMPEDAYAKAITLQELFDGKYPPPVLWTKFFGYKGFLHVLAADPDAGKTYALYNEMLRFAEAGYKSFFAHFDTDGFGTMTAYFKDFINPKDLKISKNGVTDKIKILSCNEGNGLITWASLERSIREFNPDFIVYDSLMPMIAVLEGDVPDQGNTPVWHNIMKKIKNLSAKPIEVAVVINHHLNKKGGVNGNQGIISGSDAVTIMKKMELFDQGYDENTRIYHAIKLRNTDERNFRLTLKKDIDFYTFQKNISKGANCEDRLKEMIEIEEEISIADTITTLIAELGTSKITVRRAAKNIGLKVKKGNRQMWVRN